MLIQKMRRIKNGWLIEGYEKGTSTYQTEFFMKTSEVVQSLVEEDKKVKLAGIAKIDDDYYFGEGKKSMLEREADINTWLIQITAIVNELVDRENKR